MNGKFRKLKETFGFIAGEDGLDYFFHWTDMSKFTKQFRYCREDESITFEPGFSDRGPRAFKIEVVGHTINPLKGSEGN